MVVVVYPPPLLAWRLSDCPVVCSAAIRHSIVPAARPPPRGSSTSTGVTTLCLQLKRCYVTRVCVCLFYKGEDWLRVFVSVDYV